MKKILAVIVVALGLAGAVVYGVNQSNTNDSSPQEASQLVQEQASAGISFSDDGKAVSYQGEEGVTALATLESLTEVTTQDSDFGRFVTGINGVEADGSSEFWAFYVNGEMANEGAGTYEAKAGDVFEWGIEEIR